jgi:alpha-tubulin suppressor-like RCC1 family protein
LSVSSNFIAHAWSRPNAICLATNPFGTVVFSELLPPRETTVPNGLVAKQVAAGGQFSCALKMDNTVECWGGNNSEKTTVPNGLVAKPEHFHPTLSHKSFHFLMQLV